MRLTTLKTPLAVMNAVMGEAAMYDKVSRLLADLGDTREQVAAFLEGQGIRNEACSVSARTRQCPIAQYLIRALGIDAVSVGFDSVMVGHSGLMVPIPAGASAYILWADDEVGL